MQLDAEHIQVGSEDALRRSWLDDLADEAYRSLGQEPEDANYLLAFILEATTRPPYSKEHPDLVGQGKHLIVESYAQFIQSAYEDGIEKATLGIQLLEGSDEFKWKARAYGMIGNCYGRMGQRDEATENLRQGLQIARDGDCKREIATILNTLADEEPNAIEIYEEALKITREINERELEAVVSANLSQDYIEKGNLERAQALLASAESLAREVTHWSLLGFILNCQGLLYETIGNLEMAIDRFNQGIELAKRRSDLYVISNTLANLATCESKRGNHIEAVNYIDQALEISIEMQQQTLMLEQYKQKAKTLTEAGRTDEAMAAFWTYDELKDQIIIQEKEEQRQSLFVKYQSDAHKLEARLEKEKNAELEKLVTERTRALQTSLEQAKVAQITKDRFLARMNHELRTPINAILGYSEIINEVMEDEPNLDIDGEISHSVERILGSGKNLLGLINDILEVTQLGSGSALLSVSLIELEPFINGILEWLTPFLEENNNHITISNDFLDQSFYGDLHKLDQILRNLLGNANKFTQDGKIELSINEIGDDAICFTVSDTGIGIEEEHFATIFEPFKQVEDAYNRQFEGSGLGLAISKQLALAMRGEISVQSKVGSGSEFKLIIPLHTEPG